MTEPGDGAAVVARDLSKRFETTTALDRVSFKIRRAELFGFVGPDGAGKTTLFRILATVMRPSTGTAHVLGQDVVSGLWTLRPRIGYMPGRFSLYPDLSVLENLRFFASVFGTSIEGERERIDPIYKQLEPFNDRRAAALSGGMKQKLALCCALVHRPDILLLDEPTTGVDAVSRREFWDLLGGMKSSGMTIVVSTPYMDEANRCDRVALIQRGRLLAVDAPARIAASFGRPLFAVHAGGGAERYRVLLALREYAHTKSVYPFGEALHYTDTRANESDDDVAASATTFLAAKGFSATRIERIEPTVEDVFIERMGAPEGTRAA
jgi:ABC-type multidrug transport system ATPase subunit